jgi:hypothetical protein
MSQSNSNPPSPSPSLPSKLTSSLQAARRGESPTPSTPTRRTHGILTPTARKQALRDFYNLDKSKPTSSVTDLDREDFDGKDYVDKLVRERNLTTLIIMENDLVQGDSPLLLKTRLTTVGRYSEFGWREKITRV